MTGPSWHPPRDVVELHVARPAAPPSAEEIAERLMRVIEEADEDDARFGGFSIVSAPRPPFDLRSRDELAGTIREALEEERPPDGPAIVRIANGRKGVEFVDAMLSLFEERFEIDVRLGHRDPTVGFETSKGLARALAEWLVDAEGFAILPGARAIAWGDGRSQRAGWITLAPRSIQPSLGAPAETVVLPGGVTMVLAAPRPFESAADNERIEMVAQALRRATPAGRAAPQPMISRVLGQAPPPPPFAAAPPPVAAVPAPAPPAAIPVRAAQHHGQTMDLGAAIAAAGVSLPFASASRGAPRSEPPAVAHPAAPSTGTIDLTEALRHQAAAGAPKPVGLSMEQYAWLYVEVALGTQEQKQKCFERFAIAGAQAWEKIDETWQRELAMDRSRWNAWYALVAKYRQNR